MMIDFYGGKAKKKIKKKIQDGWLKKRDFQLPQILNFFEKIFQGLALSLVP